MAEAQAWWEVWKKGIYADEFLAASETAWDFLVDAPAAILGTEEPKTEGPSWWDEVKMMRFRAEAGDLFETLYRSVCVLPLPTYNANVQATEAAIRANYGDVEGLFPDWWGPLTAEQYIQRRTEQLDCPVPVMELHLWLGPGTTAEEVPTTGAAPPPPRGEAGLPPPPMPTSYVPPAIQKKPMSGAAFIGIGLVVAGGGYLLYRLIAPPKKGRGRRKKRKALAWW